MARSIAQVFVKHRPGTPIPNPVVPPAADVIALGPLAVDRLIAGEYRRWIPLLGAWLAIAFSVGFGLFVNYRAQGRDVTFVSALMAMIPHYMVWALASPAIYRALHKTIEGVNRVFWLTMLLGWSVVASLASTGASYLSYSMRHDLPLGLNELIDIYVLPPAGPAFHAMNLSILALALGAFAAVRGLRLRDRALWAAAQAQLRHAERETQVIEARLRALQAQINPHFLLNCLNSIAGLVRLEERERAFDAIGELGELLRTALIASNDRQGTLADELAFVARYLKLCELRFGSRVSWIISVPEGLRHRRVPALVVQPLLENAMKHGIEAERSMRIEIRGYVEGQAFVVEVSDDGRGMTAEAAAAPPSGHALSNIAERMRLYYGGRGSLRIEPRQPRGTNARLIFPL
jgi:signal transduction histidine kinase